MPESSLSNVTEERFVAELRSRGVTHITTVRFKENRRTLISPGRDGKSLNVHVGYRQATREMFDYFATLLKDRGRRTYEAQAASSFLLRYPPVQRALDAVRKEKGRRDSLRSLTRGRGAPRVGPNAATPAQQQYLEAFYRHLNDAHFEGRLPNDIPLRLSKGAKSAYGWVKPWTDPADGQRKIGEIALHMDLMREENDAERLDTMLHEMAHVAAWIFDGDRGHGRHWKRWARRAGCSAERCAQERITKREDRRMRVTRVPPLPEGAERDRREPARPRLADRAGQSLRPAAQRENPAAPAASETRTTPDVDPPRKIDRGDQLRMF